MPIRRAGQLADACPLPGPCTDEPHRSTSANAVPRHPRARGNSSANSSTDAEPHSCPISKAAVHALPRADVRTSSRANLPANTGADPCSISRAGPGADATHCLQGLL